MNYYDYLKKRFPGYVVSGLILGVLLFLVIIAHRYGAYIENLLSGMDRMQESKISVGKQIEEINAARMYLERNFRIDVTNIDPDAYLFSTLDDIKSNLRNAAITVSDFETANGRRKLPVTIVVGVYNYKTMLEHLRYLESFRMPGFRIRHIKIEQGAGKVLMNIQGVIVMPLSGSSNNERSYG